MAENIQSILQGLVTKVSRKNEGGQDVLILTKNGETTRIPIPNVTANQSTNTYE